MATATLLLVLAICSIVDDLATMAFLSLIISIHITSESVLGVVSWLETFLHKIDLEILAGLCCLTITRALLHYGEQGQQNAGRLSLPTRLHRIDTVSLEKILEIL